MEDKTLADNVIATSLCVAAHKDQRDVIIKLLNKGHSVNLTDNRGWSPLHVAVSQGHTECVDLLLANGADVNACTYEGMTPLFVTCKFQDRTDLISTLLKHGCNCQISNHEKVTPLHVACKRFKIEMAQQLINNGAEINAMDFNSFTPLMDSINEFSIEKKEEYSVEMLLMLIDKGADVNSVELHGRTPLMLAVSVGWEESIRILLDNGAHVNARTNDRATSLLLAAQRSSLKTVQLLLNYGADPHLACDAGTVPLHQALHKGHLSIAKELLNSMEWQYLLIKYQPQNILSFLILAIDSGSLDCLKFVLENKLTSTLIDKANASLNDTLLCQKHFNYIQTQQPLGFLLSLHVDEHYTIPMYDLLISENCSINAVDKYTLPPLTALIGATFSEGHQDLFNNNKLKCFFKLMESGADIDYKSVRKIRGMQLPDAVLAVLMPRSCSVGQNLLIPVLGHCLACDWNELLLWLVAGKTCNAAVVQALASLGSASSAQLLQLWTATKCCPCRTCSKNFHSVHKNLCNKNVTLQQLSRIHTRRWLWSKTNNSAEAKKLLHTLRVPSTLQQYIFPSSEEWQ